MPAHSPRFQNVPLRTYESTRNPQDSSSALAVSRQGDLTHCRLQQYDCGDEVIPIAARFGVVWKRAQLALQP